MPADTFAEGPPSGAWLQERAPAVPQFPSQPVQGVSSLWPSGAHEWWALSDNGFGTKANSGDFLLRLYRVGISWESGHVEVRAHLALADPDRKLPFPIAREITNERWLTGADLDPESMVRMSDGSFWIGDEFGPFLIHVGADGRVLEAPYELPGLKRSPDHPHLAAADAGQRSVALVARSRGFEGLARQGDHLFAVLEAETGGAAFAVIYEFDLRKRLFTGQSWRVPLPSHDHGMTELVSLATLGPECASRFLAIVRDNGHGPAARFKRVYELQLTGSSVVSRLVGDLLHIANPRRLGGHDVEFRFPFITPEALWPTTRAEFVIANDNNFPARGGRNGSQRDPTEFIRVTTLTPLCNY